MQTILILLLGVGIGGVVAWLWANAKSKSELATYKIRAEGDLRVAETTISDLRIKQAESRTELDAKNQELTELHGQLRAEGEQKAAAQAEKRTRRLQKSDPSRFVNGKVNFQEIPDNHSVAIVCSHLGSPLYKISPGHYQVHDTNPQVNDEPLDRYKTAVDALLASV
jgi:hypothetical protein